MKLSNRFRAILLALLVTFLWSTSWVLIKTMLAEIPPLIFAGLRYSLACLILLPGAWKHRSHIRSLSACEWRNLAILGVVFYTFTQGGQFITLNHLDAIPFSLLLNLTVVLVALFGIITLREAPSRKQWCGIGLFLAGILVYFFPLVSTGSEPAGYFWAAFTVCANAAAALLGRSVNSRGSIPPLVVTVISMGVGAALLMGAGLAIESFPRIGYLGWIVILWLAAINTALAFTWWNRTLKILTAVESSIINNTMLVQIALLAWLFLGERLNVKEGIGCILVLMGVLMVQLGRVEGNNHKAVVRSGSRGG
ncbi:MAG: EamA family transporter [Anaerolineales bacterium]|nr:EamA family transporter [Anaerolineales bacterium]